MNLPRPADTLARVYSPQFLGGLVVVVLAFIIDARWGIHGKLSRDQAIYAYGGQQMSHGLAPYASIFDPKAPMATIISGLASLVGRLFGHGQLTLIRLAFGACSLATVLAIYLLALRLWRSVLAAVMGSIVFATFMIFSNDAFNGPDAKTPGILAAVLSMWFLVERRWFLGAVAAGFAITVWQPLLIYPLVAIVVPLFHAERGGRLRRLGLQIGGVVAPWVPVFIYFAITSDLGYFYGSAIDFPLNGIKHPPFNLGKRLTAIHRVANDAYGKGGFAILAIGAVLLLILVAAHLVRRRRQWRQALLHPLFCVVLVTFLFNFGYTLYDFQGGPDTLPYTPYPALGFAGAVALLMRALSDQQARRVATAVLATAATVLFAVCWVGYGHRAAKISGLSAQYSDACAVERMLGPTGVFYSIGDPMPLVLTHRRNPDRYIYLGERVFDWKINHTHGGFDGWTAQILRANPAVIVLQGWHGPVYEQMKKWLKTQFQHGFVGTWLIFFTSEAGQRANQTGVNVTQIPSKVAHDLTGRRIPSHSGCAHKA